MTDTPEAVAARLDPSEREWLTGWQGPAGAAFNVVATGLVRKGLLKSHTDWNLSELGERVIAHLKVAE